MTAYLIVKKNGKPLRVEKQVLIYWRLNVAKEEAKKRGCEVKKVEIIFNT